MRPKGLKNPYEAKPGNAADLDRIGREIAFEAGADALLEGLEKGDYFIRVTDKAVTMPGFEATVDDTVRGAGDGLWVFIPEEKG